jgi:DNA-binding NarL/FixJ family response regulator
MVLLCIEQSNTIHHHMKPIRLAIADDNTFALKAIVEKLKGTPDIFVKLTAFDGVELLHALQRDAVMDVVLMDIQMPELNGIETTRQVKRLYPQLKVIMLTTFDDDEKIFESIMAGASGYLLKDEPEEKIINALHEAMQGGAAMSPGIALKALNLIRNPFTPGTTPTDFGLTKREVELLEQLKGGLSYEQAAVNLFISTGTVQKHIGNIYRKLQVNNKVEAVQKAMQHRIV